MLFLGGAYLLERHGLRLGGGVTALAHHQRALI